MAALTPYLTAIFIALLLGIPAVKAETCPSATAADRARIEEAAKALGVEIHNPTPRVTGERCATLVEDIRQNGTTVATITVDRGKEWNRAELETPETGGIPLPEGGIVTWAMALKDGKAIRQYQRPDGTLVISRGTPAGWKVQ